MARNSERDNLKKLIIEYIGMLALTFDNIDIRFSAYSTKEVRSAIRSLLLEKSLRKRPAQKNEYIGVYPRPTLYEKNI